MRRKSPRTAAKAAPEKQKSPAKRTRRYTRRKKQSTSESSEDSQGEQSLQEIAKQAAEAAEKAKTVEKEEEPEPVWKVTPANTATGEVQKLKICLTRPSSSTPERSTRRRRYKSGGEDRSTPNEESSTQEDEKSSEVEEREEKKGKGKSKGKNKSKIEKTPKPDEQEAEMQSEISENVQVTAQSPPIDIPVDNCDAMPKEDKPQIADNVASVESVNDNATVGDRAETTNNEDIPLSSQHISDHTDTAKVEDGDAVLSPKTQPSETTSETAETQISAQAETEAEIQSENITTDSSSTITKDVEHEEIDKVAASAADEPQIPETENAEPEVKGEEVEEHPKEDSEKQEDSKEQVPVEEPAAEEETAVVNEEEPAVQEKESKDLQEHDEVEKIVEEASLKQPEGSPESVPSQNENTINEMEYMEVDVSESEHFRILSEEMAEEQKNNEVEITPMKQRKRKWGNCDSGFQTCLTNLFKIDVDTVKNICTEVRFLDEEEVKLESTPPEERRKSTEHKQKKQERKVSVDEPSRPEFKTQTSINSTNSESETSANIIAMNRKISIVDDTASKLKPPPSPAKNPVSEVLYITNLVRPFTLKQLKELLERTGKIKEDGFWTDHIKSKCYVQYESAEEAEATRNALHGVQWPIGNGKKLIIEYSTGEEMEKARNPPQAPPPVVAETKPPEKENEIPMVKEDVVERGEERREKRKKETQVREWDIGKEELERGRSRSRERSERKRHGRRSASVDDFIARKQKKQEEAPPQKLMDDLFQKTKATPCIYWLPLTPEEIALKQQQRLIRMEEHKRRLEEAVRSRPEFGRGGPYRRRYD